MHKILYNNIFNSFIFEKYIFIRKIIFEKINLFIIYLLLPPTDSFLNFLIK